MKAVVSRCEGAKGRDEWEKGICLIVCLCAGLSVALHVILPRSYAATRGVVL
jgi:hypothetical protein